MSLYPCSACGNRPVGQRLANATWAWWTAAQQRVAYRQRLCTGCFAEHVATLEQSTRDFNLMCPACGIGTSGDMDPVYLTIYVPSVGKLRLEMPTCAPCAANLRIFAQRGAERLDDSNVESGGRGPQTETATDPWAALGLQPRD